MLVCVTLRVIGSILGEFVGDHPQGFKHAPGRIILIAGSCPTQALRTDPGRPPPGVRRFEALPWLLAIQNDNLRLA